MNVVREQFQILHRGGRDPFLFADGLLVPWLVVEVVCLFCHTIFFERCVFVIAWAGFRMMCERAVLMSVLPQVVWLGSVLSSGAERVNPVQGQGRC